MRQALLRAFLTVSALATVALVRQTRQLGGSIHRRQDEPGHHAHVHPSALPEDYPTSPRTRASYGSRRARRSGRRPSLVNSSQLSTTEVARDNDNLASKKLSRAHHVHMHQIAGTAPDAADPSQPNNTRAAAVDGAAAKPLKTNASGDAATLRVTDEDEPPALQLSVSTDAEILGEVAPEYISTTMDWWSKSTEGWGNSSVLNADLSNPQLLTAARGLQPFFLRIGGSQADEIVYTITRASDNNATLKELKAQCKRNRSKCLTRERWDAILEFVSQIGARVVFTLAYVRHTRDGEGNNDARDWDSSNARRFLEYTSSTKHAGRIYGFELGNELRHKGKVRNVTRIAEAYKELGRMVDEIWSTGERKRPKPKIMGPASTGREETTSLLEALGPHLSIASYHKYLGSGKDANLAESAKRPDWQRHPVQLAGPGEAVAHFMSDNTETPELWIGEGAMAYNSGRAGVTDSFVGSLWFANLLGALAKTKPHAHRVYCRQAMIGGYYELISHETLAPNPDFWMAYVWKNLVGTKAIGPIHSPHREDSAELSSQLVFGCCEMPGSDSILVHAFCAKESNGDVAFLVINIDASKAIQLNVNMGTKRTEYILSPNEEGHQSREVRLNGRTMRIEDGRLPKVRGTVRQRSERVHVPPISIAFLVVSGADVTACRGQADSAVKA